MSRKSISTKGLNTAQEKLNKLCKEHGLDPWNIEASKGKAGELVRRLCGLKPMLQEASTQRRRGAPERYSKEQKKEIVEAVEAARFGCPDMQLNQDFGRCDVTGKRNKAHMKRKDAFDKVIKEKNIPIRKREVRGTNCDPRNAIRKIYDTAKLELEKEEEKYRQELSRLHSDI